jgi:hypothetical protein
VKEMKGSDGARYEVSEFEMKLRIGRERQQRRRGERTEQKIAKNRPSLLKYECETLIIGTSSYFHLKQL